MAFVTETDVATSLARIGEDASSDEPFIGKCEDIGDCLPGTSGAGGVSLHADGRFKYRFLTIS